MAMTVSLDDEASAALRRLADVRGQSVEALAREAILDKAAEEAEIEAAFEEAEKDIQAGRVHSHDEALAILAAMRADAEAEIVRRRSAA